MLKEKRLQVALTEEDLKRLQELADENTAENKSYLIRRLIGVAWEKPELFGLNLPKAAALIGMAN